jgi:hypothetical protein
MLHITAQLIIRLFLMGLLAATSASALSREPWNPVTVDVWEPAFNDERLRVEKTYEPLSQATMKPAGWGCISRSSTLGAMATSSVSASSSGSV